MSLLLLEPGSFLLLEGTDRLLLEVEICPPPEGFALLLEPGMYLMLDGCDHLLLERGGPTPPPTPSQQGRANTGRRLGRPNEAMEDEDLLLILSLWMKLK